MVGKCIETASKLQAVGEVAKYLLGECCRWMLVVWLFSVDEVGFLLLSLHSQDNELVLCIIGCQASSSSVTFK